MSDNNNSSSFGWGLLGGILGGIVAGILLAPKPGQETREELKEAVSDIAEKCAPKLQEAQKKALESIDLVRYQLEKQYNKLNSSIKAKNLRKAKEKESNASKNH